jgi:hypothetical protein
VITTVRDTNGDRIVKTTAPARIQGLVILMMEVVNAILDIREPSVKISVLLESLVSSANTLARVVNPTVPVVQSMARASAIRAIEDMTVMTLALLAPGVWTVHSHALALMGSVTQ